MRRFHFNGVNGRTGKYLVPPLEPGEVALRARRLRLDPALARELARKRARKKRDHLGVGAGVDAADLASAGWAVVFADDEDTAVRDALRPLLRHRADQAGSLYREVSYRAGESKNALLVRHGIGPGTVVPGKMPYYLMIVGDPERIPYRLQYELDVAYAVGRISLPTPEAYAQYASNVVRSETCTSVLPPPRVAFFGVRNEDDEATRLSSEYLIAPLARAVAHANSTWHVETVCGETATKARLQRMLGGPDTPRLLMTASHGMGFPKDDPLQEAHQGALLCGDWPGPLQHEGSIPRAFYFSADDVHADANLSDSITFHFACFGAGTPRVDDFPEVGQAEPDDIAQRAFVARLAQRLLAHPRGPLAVVGHVDRAWGFSFIWDGQAELYEAFRSAVSVLMDGMPLGMATEFFNQRYADIASMLVAELEEMRFGKVVDELALADLWTANTDARNFVVVGDPAVRLRIQEELGVGRAAE